MNCNDWPLAVCSWSLRNDVEGVAAALRELNIDRVNLALKPAFAERGADYVQAVRRQGWTISATTIGFPQEDYTTLESIRATGGIVPDAFWPANRQRILQAVALTVELGAPYLTTHAGSLESDAPAQRRKVRDRLAELADAAARHGVVLLLETGQETAGALRELLVELQHPALGVNFDPANMILYDKGNPVDAVSTLGRWIKHVHVKDAQRTRQPGAWGSEVPWGEGEVGAAAFLRALRGVGYRGTLAIERESGDNRQGDIQWAARRLVDTGRRLDSGDNS